MSDTPRPMKVVPGVVGKVPDRNCKSKLRKTINSVEIQNHHKNDSAKHAVPTTLIFQAQQVTLSTAFGH